MARENHYVATPLPACQLACRGLFLTTAVGHAGTVDLASTMNPGNGVSGAGDTPIGGLISENAVTGSYAQIARDQDGLYNVADPSQAFGSIDLFPNEQNFTIGTLTYYGAALAGTETRTITGMDTSGFWQQDSSTTDVNDASGFDFWFFGTGSTIAFGTPTGTVDFLNGQLVSTDLTAPVTFTIDHAADQVTHTGTFTISGNSLSIQVNDTQEVDLTAFNAGIVNSTLVVDLAGTVNAVVPEPASAVLLMLAAAGLVGRRLQR